VFSVSRDGILVYQTAQEQARGQLQWMDPAGRVGARVGEPNSSYALRLSPDGSRASVIEGDPNSDLWVYELERGFRTRLTTNEQVILTPLWTRDGSEILYVSGTSATVGSDYKLLRRPSFGGGKVAEVLRSKVRIEPTDVSPDGKYLVVDHGVIGTTAIWLYPLAEPDKGAPLMEPPALQTDGRPPRPGAASGEARLRWAFPRNERQRVSAGAASMRAGRRAPHARPVSQDNERWRTVEGGAQPRPRSFSLQPRAARLARSNHGGRKRLRQHRTSRRDLRLPALTRAEIVPAQQPRGRQPARSAAALMMFSRDAATGPPPASARSSSRTAV
jgi:hypothetical protein